MIECPNCRNEEYVGTLICEECGMRLVHVVPGGQWPEQAGPSTDSTTRPVPGEAVDLAGGAIIGLRVIKANKVVSLLGRENYTLGRSGEGQAILPDVDLAPYQAFDLGVSRIHAEMRVSKEGFYILDLESANGTRVNGKLLTAQVPYPIRHGDLIQLGGLELQLISRT
jgi:pSer/pThr/pTyr-binding forkhead associated (FHA) protein